MSSQQQTSPTRTQGMTVLAWVDIVLGLLGSALGGYFLFHGIAILRDSGQNRANAMVQGCDALLWLATFFERMAVVVIVVGAVTLIVHLAMVVAGVGLLRMAPWARPLGIGVAVAFLITGGGVLGAAYSVPAIVLFMKPEWKAAFPPQAGCTTTDDTDGHG